MLRQLVVEPGSATVYRGLSASPPGQCSQVGRRRWRKRRETFWVTAAVNSHRQNHYAVLGVSRSASFSDIKKAYRLLARKWHPDVSKDSRAGEVFKNIHLAYQVLSNEVTRVQYDRVLKSHEYGTEHIRRSSHYNSQLKDELRILRWKEIRQKMRNSSYHYHNYYNDGGENFSYYTQSDEEDEDDTLVEDRGSFIEVLRSVFLSLFLMRTVGCQLSIMFSSLMALVDKKLDAGYKLGYLIALVMGGRAGILLSMCLAFASWACGKNSSGTVVVVVVAMWVGSNVLSCMPLPQGALLALLYMSVKLQVDSN